MKTLKTIFNALGLIIDRPILEFLHIDKDTPPEIETDGKSLIIRPVTPEEQKRQVRGATMRIMDAYDKTLRMLAK